MAQTVRALVLLTAVGGAGAQFAKLSDGLYCPVSDVEQHANVVKDVAEISSLLGESPPNYAQAKTVYVEGMHSSKGPGMFRTLQGLAQKNMTTDKGYPNVFYTSAVALYGSTNAVWEDLMIACFDDADFCQGKSDDFKKYVINKGCLGILTAYVTYEMGAAIWKAAEGQTADTQAPHAWDEAAAFYIGNIPPLVGDGVAGSAPGNFYSPYEFNWKRDSDFPDGVNTHEAALPILNFGLLNVRASGYNAANAEAAVDEMYKVFSIAAIRSAIKYSWKAYGGGTFSEKYLAEGFIYWRSASGYLSAINRTLVEEIDALLALDQTSLAADVPCQVKAKVEALYPGLGISCATMGKWKDAEAGSCLDSICSYDGGSPLHGGSTAYVDSCQAITSGTSVDDLTTTATDEASVSGAAAASGIMSILAAAGQALA